MLNKPLEQPRYGCPLGAQQTVLGIPRAIPIIHAGPGCSSKMGQFLCEHSGFQSGGYAGESAVPSTNFSESEVVFGGERKLRAAIEGSAKVMDGDLFVVITGCTADIVGDDTSQIVSEFRDAGMVIASVEAGGFKGNNYTGHELVLEAIINQIIDDAEPSVQPGLVNVFSVIPYQNTFWRGDLEVIKRLLQSIGLTPNVMFGYGAGGLKEIRSIPNAQFNLVLSPWIGLSAAELLQKKYKTPYFHYPTLPVGATETSRFLKTVAAFAGIPERVVNEVTSREEARYYEYLAGAVDYFTEWGNHLPYVFHTVADSAYALSFASFFVNDLGYLPGVQILTENPPEQYLSIITDQFKAIGIDPVFENDGKEIQAQLTKKLVKKPHSVVLGSSWEQDVVKKGNSWLIRVSLPIYDRLVLAQTYLGYTGGLSLLADIHGKVLGA